MNDNSITRFEVSNFKKFDHLVVENIGQVNLITGDNNVGKTTLLEALLYDDNNVKWISHLHQTLCIRKIHFHPTEVNTKEPKFPDENYLKYIAKNIDEHIVCSYLSVSGKKTQRSIKHKNIEDITDNERKFRKDKYLIDNVKDWVLFYTNNEVVELQWLYFDDVYRNMQYKYWPLITFNASYGDDLPYYLEILSKETNGLDYSDKKKIMNFLQIWITDIVDFELKKFGTDSIIGIATKSNQNYRAITQFGDGIQKLFRYILEILYAQKNRQNRLMIDEIDTGVHYLRMKDEWKAVFELSKQTGIQIFATTHSMDCIKAFVEAGEEVSDLKGDLRLIELEEFTTKDGTNRHTATTYNHDTLKFKLETETNVRGGNVWQ